MSPTTTPEQQQLASLTALVTAQAARRERFTTQAVATATNAVKGFKGWYDSTQITAWAAKVASQIEALQRAQAQSTDVYLARAISEMSGQRARPVGRVNVSDLRTGVTHAGAYARSADAYRWQQHQIDAFATVLTSTDPGQFDGLDPVELVDPVDAAVQRAGAVADMDIQLADSHQTKASLSASKQITGWRRVIHPELARTGTCGLCIAASNRIYHVSDLRPIHPACHCTTLPIMGSADPGNSLNNLDLQTLYAHSGSTSGKALRQTRYSVDEHGELGPVLTDGTFRTPSTVKADRQRRPSRTPEQQREVVQQILASQQAAQPIADQLAKSDPQKWGAYAGQLDDRVESLRSQLAA